MPFSIVFLEGVGNVIVDTTENEDYWIRLEEAEHRARLEESHGISDGDSCVSLENIVYHILRGERESGRYIRLVIEALEALHLYDKDIVWSVMDALNVGSSRRLTNSEVMRETRTVVEICLNNGKDAVEKQKGFSRIAPQWTWTSPQHYAAVA